MFQRRVRRMAGQARQPSLAFAETTGWRPAAAADGAAFHGLRRSGVAAHASGHAMALSAESVQTSAPPACPGLLRPHMRRIADVRGRGAVARLAADAKLVGHDGLGRHPIDGSSGVAREAAEDAGRRIEDPITRACIGVARRESAHSRSAGGTSSCLPPGNAPDPRRVTNVMACSPAPNAHSPGCGDFDLASARAWALRLRLELGRMALAACFRPGVIGREAAQPAAAAGAASVHL